MFMTIEGFESLSQQAIFNMAVAHIAGTRTKSVKGGVSTACCYSGSGCAASPFLRPLCRATADTAEDADWASLAYDGKVPKHEMLLIGDIQNAHDKSHIVSFMADWKARMQKVATRFNLDTTELDKVEV